MQPFTVQLNGQPCRIQPGLTLRDLLSQRRLDEVAPFVVAVNDEHVAHAKLASQQLKPGDRIEVLTVHQGG